MVEVGERTRVNDDTSDSGSMSSDPFSSTMDWRRATG